MAVTGSEAPARAEGDRAGWVARWVGAHPVDAVAAVLIVVSLAWRAQIASRGYLAQDDFLMASQATESELTLQYLLRTYNHLMPAGLLLTWLITRAVGLAYWPYVLLLTAGQGGAQRRLLPAAAPAAAAGMGPAGPAVRLLVQPPHPGGDLLVGGRHDAAADAAGDGPGGRRPGAVRADAADAAPGDLGAVAGGWPAVLREVAAHRAAGVPGDRLLVRRRRSGPQRQAHPAAVLAVVAGVDRPVPCLPCAVPVACRSDAA